MGLGLGPGLEQRTRKRYGEGKFVPRDVGKARPGTDPQGEVSVGPRRGRSSNLEIVPLKQYSY